MKLDVSKLKFDDRGMIPAIVQDVKTDKVLMLAYMNGESLARTIETGYTWFWSRSHGRNCGTRVPPAAIPRRCTALPTTATGIPCW